MKKIALFLIAFCSFAFAEVIPTEPAVDGGCYSISNADELFGFAAIVNGTLTKGRNAEPSACGKLTADIYANNKGYDKYSCGFVEEENEVTGEMESVYKCFEIAFEDGGYAVKEVDSSEVVHSISWTPLKNFSGTFDGQGFTIEELKNIEDTTQNNLGFIASVSGGSAQKPVVIRNLNINSSIFKGQDTVGGVVAKNSGYLLLDNVNSLTSAYGRNHVASVVARNEGNLVIKKGHASTARGKQFVGAAVGSNSGSIEIDSLSFVGETAKGTYFAYVTAESYAGVVLGVNENSASLKIRNVATSDNNYTAQISADSIFGGFVGLNEKNATVSVSESFGNSAVGGTNDSYVGGVVAINRGIVDVANSYVKGSVLGKKSGCFVGVNEDSLSITNSWSACIQNENSQDPVVAQCDGRISLKNVFYKEYSKSCGYTCQELVSFDCAEKLGAKSVTSTEISNGTLAISLHNYKNGEVWGQEVTGDYRGDQFPKLYAPFGTYEFKLDLQENQSYFKYEDSLEPTSYVYGQGLNLPVPKVNGYKFLGWYYEDDDENLVESIGNGVYGDKILKAKWDGKPAVPSQDEDGCYLISSISDFYGITLIKSKNCIKLINDIVVNEDTSYVEEAFIGESPRTWTGTAGYNGIFDGQGYKISGLYLKGIFSKVSKGDTLTIKNLGVVATCIKDDHRGLLVESNEGVVIIDSCYSASTSGGFVGINKGDLKITNSYNTGAIVTGTYDYQAGSMVTVNEGNLVIDRVYNTGKVNAGGGIVGSNEGTAVISNSYNTGTFSSFTAGGIVGKSSGKLMIVNCYNTADINGFEQTGGLIGVQAKGVFRIVNSYSAGQITGNAVGRNYGIVGLRSVSPIYLDDHAFYMDNVYYPKGLRDTTGLGIQASPAVFANGYVAKLLHDYVEKDADGNVVEGGITGEIWGQNVGVDPLPNFSGKVIGAVGTAADGDIVKPHGPYGLPNFGGIYADGYVFSSSCEITSSNSSSAASSGSAVSSGSDAANLSSSGEAVPVSSSSDQDDDITVAQVSSQPVVRVSAVRIGRGALITGIPAQERFSMFDLQGHRVASGVSGLSGVVLDLVSEGRYLIVMSKCRFIVDIRP